MFAGEENSRVQAHIDGNEFSAHILTDETEYNVEVTVGTMSYTMWDYVSIDFLSPLFSAFQAPLEVYRLPDW